MAASPIYPDSEAKAAVGVRSAEPPATEGKEVNGTLTELLASLRVRLERQAGQTMAEYGVVLGIIILGVVLAFTALSGGISNAITNVAAIFGK